MLSADILLYCNGLYRMHIPYLHWLHVESNKDKGYQFPSVDRRFYADKIIDILILFGLLPQSTKSTAAYLQLRLHLM